MHQSSVSRVISDVVKKSVWNLLNKCINSAEGVYAVLEDWVAANFKFLNLKKIDFHFNIILKKD